MARGNAIDDLDAWVLATAPRAVAYATSLLRDRHRAEDVVQDCYCRLLQKADVYDLPHSGVRLLFKAITRACINLTTRKRPMLSLHAVRGPDGDEALTAEDTRTAAPEQVLVHRELEQAVGEALARLPIQQRAALEMRSLGHSQQEIADLLQVSPSHAGVLVHRARQAMATLLAPLLGEAPRMNEKQHDDAERIERLVREHLLREAQSVDAASILAGARTRVATGQPVLPPSPPKRARRWAGRLAVAMAASLLLAVLWALPVGTPQASAETLLRQAQQAHARPIDLCYLRTEFNPPALEGDVLPPLPPEVKVWTRGDRFFMQTVFRDRTNAWGRDAQGRVWFAPLPRAGFRFEAHEVPEPLARNCDLQSMNLDKLLADVLTHLDLHKSEASPNLQVVEAQPRANRPFFPLRFVRLEIDAHWKLIRKIEIHRRHPQGLSQTTFTLVEKAPPREDGDYTLEGHLAPDARIYSLDDPPPLRLKILRKHYEMGRRNGP